jgi:hypothetical protein
MTTPGTSIILNTNPQDDHRRRKTFESECRAYEIAAQDAFLHGHIPGSFRRCEIADVVDDGESSGIKGAAS